MPLLQGSGERVRAHGVAWALAGVLAAPAAGCAPSARHPESPKLARDAPATFRVRIDTTKGPILIEAHREWAPQGADRFFNLVRSGYFDDTRFFRVVNGQWAQFGINGDPAIAALWRDRTIPDDPPKRSNGRGMVAFAFAVPNGRTTQVFINLRDNSAVNDKEPFTPFGQIVEGLDVADALNTEYGETAVGGIRAGKQDKFFDGGNAFLLSQFPRLDVIRTARVR
jgi:peptidyl-prolyl cis-trans isomerase A (cyclophilin A)